jgi:hypothetical protein
MIACRFVVYIFWLHFWYFHIGTADGRSSVFPTSDRLIRSEFGSKEAEPTMLEFSEGKNLNVI